MNYVWTHLIGGEQRSSALLSSAPSLSARSLGCPWPLARFIPTPCSPLPCLQIHFTSQMSLLGAGLGWAEINRSLLLCSPSAQISSSSAFFMPWHRRAFPRTARRYFYICMQAANLGTPVLRSCRIHTPGLCTSLYITMQEHAKRYYLRFCTQLCRKLYVIACKIVRNYVQNCTQRYAC